MDKERIAKLKALGDMSFTAIEIAEVHEQLAAGATPCTTICAWIIRKAAATGSCTAGEVALSGIFSLAEIAFPESDEILFPLEIVIDEAWGAACAEVGIAVLGKDADEWAAKWCKKVHA